MNKKYTLLILGIITALVIGFFISSKKIYVNTPDESRVVFSESAWEIVYYSTPAQSASTRGTDWFIHFGKDTTGYLKLCETYPFTYIQEHDTHLVLSFQVQKEESPVCQDTDGLQQFLLETLKKPLTVEKKKSQMSDSMTLVLSDGQNKIALVSRSFDTTVSTAFSKTFLKKDQNVQFETQVVCSNKKECTENQDQIFFPIIISGVDESGTQMSDKKIRVQGNNTTELMLPLGTYTVTPDTVLDQSFHFEPVIFSLTTIQDDSYSIPLVLVSKK